MSDLLNQYIERLPSHFNKDKESNNYKLFQILAEQGESKQTILRIMQQYEDIDQAEGQKLDFHGQDVGCERGNMDDVEYRKRIKIQIIINLSEADIDTINTILTAYMGEDFLRLEEGWKEINEPASLLVNIADKSESFPFDVMKKIKPAGVSFYVVLNAFDEIIIEDIVSYNLKTYHKVHEFKVGMTPIKTVESEVLP